MFKPTFLYIKTHSITGLKYFGKTTKSDPVSYRGSGKYWNDHLRVHGEDFTTEILGLYYDEVSCKNAAIKFSMDNNIVKSKQWANFRNEDGLSRRRLYNWNDVGN